MTEDYTVSKIRVSLAIRGFRGNPSKITDLLKIQPHESWRKGEVIPNSPVKRKYSCWTIAASLKRYSYNVEDYVKDIIKKIAPVKNKIKRIPGANLELEIWIDLYPEASMPGIVLSKSTLRFLADIGAEVDCDLYFIDTRLMEKEPRSA
jgi:hypothetical protein